MTPDHSRRLNESNFNRISRLKSIHHRSAAPLGPQMIEFFKQSVQKRQTKMAQIAEVWAVLVPEHLTEHCALDSFTRGSLTVLVDTSAHLYGLKELLLSGVQQQLLSACKATGLRKITLKQGRWYEADETANSNRKPRFEK
jgi:hypothetical protein